MDSKQASERAKARHAASTPEEREQLGRSLVEARWKQKTPEERLAWGQFLAEARRKKRAERLATL